MLIISYGFFSIYNNIKIRKIAFQGTDLSFYKKTSINNSCIKTKDNCTGLMVVQAEDDSIISDVKEKISIKEVMKNVACINIDTLTQDLEHPKNYYLDFVVDTFGNIVGDRTYTATSTCLAKHFVPLLQKYKWPIKICNGKKVNLYVSYKMVNCILPAEE